MKRPPSPKHRINPHDENVTDDSMFRPITTPPKRDRDQAKYGDVEMSDELRQDLTVRSTERSVMPIVSLVVVAVIVIALLVYWFV